MSVPLTPQLMVLGQETPTSPSQDKCEWLPNLLSHPSNAFISGYRPVFSGIAANSLTSFSISVLWERELLQ